MSEVDWTERYSSDSALGVDHLGMRVAGETAYARLFDFTTTVSWRPRYFSFLCWNVERAFNEAPRRTTKDPVEIDGRAYRAALKHRDFAMAAATLADRPSAGVVVGSDAIGRALSAQQPIQNTQTHVTASTGSFGIYAGSMRQLGLLES